MITTTRFNLTQNGWIKLDIDLSLYINFQLNIVNKGMASLC